MRVRLGSAIILVAVVYASNARTDVEVTAAEPNASPTTRAAEASFESEAAKWGQTLYSTTVLAPKDGAAKFCTFQRGGVQTIYTSEVVGHSPLTPLRAKLSPYFDQGVMVGFATGKDLDYRAGPIVQQQQLQDGYLPIVITKWRGMSGAPNDSDSREPTPLEFEETCFVRRLADRIEVGRGDENAAAILALKIRNPAKTEATAWVRMVVNASDNSQPRGYPALLYQAPLKVSGESALNAEGKTRLMWRTPARGKAIARFLDAVPTILEFGPGAPDGVNRPVRTPEPPFTRYSATKSLENHEAHKAFDNFAMSYWTPATKVAEGAVGLGLQFPKKRWLRSVVVSWESVATMPPADGYRLEGFDGAKWTPIAAQINGKPPEELKNHPEIVTEIGPNWLLAFAEPVEVLRFRIMIDKLLAGAERPRIAAIDYNSAIATAATGEPIWTGTDSDVVANNVHFIVSIPPGKSETIYAAAPFLPANEEESRWLAAADFEREQQRVAAWWRDYLGQGAQLELPEAYPTNVFQANLHHMLCTSQRDPDTGHSITLTSLGWYEGVWASLSAVQAIALDERAFHADAASILEPFIAWQGTMKPPGEYETQQGFLSSNDPHTWVRWVSNHGFVLWAMADHSRFSADRKWLDRVLPNMLAAVDWIEQERARTKKLNADGARAPHWGLLPPGSTGDGAPNCYGFMGDAVTWRALDSVAAVLTEIEHPRAAATRAAADEYKQSILRGVEWAKANTPPYTLKSGRQIPFIANDIYNVWKINTGASDPNVNFHIWWMDVGPLHLVDMGVLDAKSDLTGHLLNAAQDRWMKGNVSTAEPYYNPQRSAFLGRDQVEDFIEMYYTLLVEGMDRQTFVTGEYHHGQQNLPSCDAEQSRTQRMMLVRETEQGVDYASATPRAWLQDGKRISFSDARTHYGKTTLVIESQAARGTITATVKPPDRRPTPLRLRLRHPEAKPIVSATLNGQPLNKTMIDGEWIKLPAGRDESRVVATY